MDNETPIFITKEMEEVMVTAFKIDAQISIRCFHLKLLHEPRPPSFPEFHFAQQTIYFVEYGEGKKSQERN